MEGKNLEVELETDTSLVRKGTSLVKKEQVKEYQDEGLKGWKSENHGIYT